MTMFFAQKNEGHQATRQGQLCSHKPGIDSKLTIVLLWTRQRIMSLELPIMDNLQGQLILITRHNVSLEEQV